MTLARYFVTRHQDDWLVTLDGRPVARFSTRRAATDEAIAMASHMGGMDHDADVMVEAVNGAPPELVWTYGQDPLPRRGHPGDDGFSHVRHVQRGL